MEALVLFTSWLVSTFATYAVVTLDERQLDEERALRAWPMSSKWSAVFAFGPICLPVHFGRTRRSTAGVLLGFVALVGVLALDEAMAWGISQM